MRQFRLEHEYRQHLARGMFDLSASAAASLSAAEVLDVAGASCATLLDAPLDYERGGGSAELRAAVASLYGGIDADNVLITAGASEAIRVVATAVLRTGDTAVVQQPCYAALRDTPGGLGARIVAWRPRTGFQFDFGLLDEEATGATAIFYNNPHGPSGSIASGSYAGHARLVADEVYRPIALVPAHTTASVLDRGDGSVSIGDLSKPLGLGGLRIGWIATRDRALLADCARVLDYQSGSVATLSARIALAALLRFDELLARQLTTARANLSLLAAFVEEHDAWVDWTPPQAGYTAFLRVRAGAPPQSLFAAMRARGVFALDGAVFDAPDHIRIGFGLETVAFSRALATFGEVIRTHVAPMRACEPDGDVIVIAKAPWPGVAKTRLAMGVGPERAAALSAAFLRDTMAFARRRGERLYVSYAPHDASGTFRSLAPDAELIAQPDGDLGARLLHAFAGAIASGARRPVLIGADSPSLPAHLLTSAQRALATHDVVLGPADDGGYYLIGMNAPQPSLFSGVDWSSDTVLAQTLERARTAGLRVFMLPYWYDIDTVREHDRLACDPLVRSETRRALALGAPAEAAAL